MATDQKTSTLGVDAQSHPSVIENELPTYRAISNLAIYSLVCGALAIFTWAHPIFYLASVSAVVLGFLAHRMIRRYPDMLTGHGLASVGIALGVVFGLGCGTYTTVQTYVRTRLAEKFARHYAEVLHTGSVGDVLMLYGSPASRQNQTGEQLLKQIQSASVKDKMMMDQKYSQLLSLKRRLDASKEEQVEFVRIETVGEDDSHGTAIPIFALALFELRGPGSKEFPEKEQYALAILKAVVKGKQYEWWVDDIRFPYKPKSYVAPVKHVDDGHGHAH